MSSMKLLRYSVAYVFITSGVMKLLSPELGDAFIGIGIPFPIQVMYGVATIEIVCGILIFMNQEVRKATMPLLAIMAAALVLTKIPTLRSGLIDFAFNARLDITMLILLSILYNRSIR